MTIEILHVIPANDIKKHEESSQCWCCPKLVTQELNGNQVWAHNVFAEAYGDERELN